MGAKRSGWRRLDRLEGVERGLENFVGMKKLPILVLAFALAAVPGVQALAKKKAPVRQTVEGSIAIPQGGNAAATCVYRAQRTAYTAGGDAVNGIVGYTFEVDPATVNQPFKLEAADGAGMDISFYADLGDASDPTTAPANIPFEETGPGGESGIVPDGYPIAFVCMTEGAEAAFTYTAGKGVK